MYFKKAGLLFSGLFFACHVAYAQDVRIGVFGLFQPQELSLTASNGSALVVHAGSKQIVLERSSGHDVARIRISGNEMILEVSRRLIRTSEIIAGSRSGDATNFILTVPGKISRHYRGRFELRACSGVLIPVVAMDLETAVASAVLAEGAPDAPNEALKAQAVATRSYFVAARGRHRPFDFCDTTHCQFLREPPAPGSPAAVAASLTGGLVLTYHDRPFASMFTRSCGGLTRTPSRSEVSYNDYPYFPVACEYCWTHPLNWTRRVSQDDAIQLAHFGEPARLEIGRRLGWDAVPSNDFIARREDQQMVLEGTGEGHGIGLCQRGAKAMAIAGADFRQILHHYFPNTTLIALPQR